MTRLSIRRRPILLNACPKHNGVFHGRKPRAVDDGSRLNKLHVADRGHDKCARSRYGADHAKEYSLENRFHSSKSCGFIQTLIVPQPLAGDADDVLVDFSEFASGQIILVDRRPKRASDRVMLLLVRGEMLWAPLTFRSPAPAPIFSAFNLQTVWRYAVNDVGDTMMTCHLAAALEEVLRVLPPSPILLTSKS